MSLHGDTLHKAGYDESCGLCRAARSALEPAVSNELAAVAGEVDQLLSEIQAKHALIQPPPGLRSGIALSQAQLLQDQMFIAQMANTRDAQASYAQAAPERIVYRDVKPSIEELAFALFETDPEVQQFVYTQCDCLMGIGTDERTRRSRRGFDIAWRRNENGWRQRAVWRAAAIRRLLDVARNLLNVVPV